MRIISGTHKGRHIVPPKNLELRPTTDFAKESIFNILNNRIDFETVSVLDVFCGTGNISFEFASRGARAVTSVDEHIHCIRFIKNEAGKLGFKQLLALKSDAFVYLKNCNSKYDIIFADPPYDLPNIADIHHLVFEKQLLNEDGILIIEHGKQTKLQDKSGFMDLRTYGNVNFSLFQTTVK